MIATNVHCPDCHSHVTVILHGDEVIANGRNPGCPTSALALLDASPQTATPAVPLVRVAAPHLQQRATRMASPDPSWYHTPFSSEERRYKWAYQTGDGRWLIQRAYGACGGGWHVIDTTGEHVGESWHGPTTELATQRTRAAAEAFLAEWLLEGTSDA